MAVVCLRPCYPDVMGIREVDLQLFLPGKFTVYMPIKDIYMVFTPSTMIIKEVT